MVNLRYKVVRLWVLMALQRNIMSRNGLSIEKYPHGRVDREHDDKPLECWVPQFQAIFYMNVGSQNLPFWWLLRSFMFREKRTVDRTAGLNQEKTQSLYIYIHIRMKYG